MKRVVSVSIGSSKRDKAVEIELLGEKVRLERIGTDGDLEKAAQLFRELDTQVDAFGVGGTNLGLKVGEKFYPLHSVSSMFRFVQQTPLVDGGGLKSTLESHLAQFVEGQIGDFVQPKRALITSATDRWGMARSFYDAGYECIFGDLMFALDIPIPIRSLRAVKILAAIILPIASRIPFHWLYPTGEKQEICKPKWQREFQWATVVAGDCHFIMRYMPSRLDGKVVVTNTTTTEDIGILRRAGVAYLVTSTPVLEGRSFGTNLMEAVLVAVADKGRPLTEPEIEEMIDMLDLTPHLQMLNQPMSNEVGAQSAHEART